MGFKNIILAKKKKGVVYHGSIFSPTVYKKRLAEGGPNHLNLLTKSAVAAA